MNIHTFETRRRQPGRNSQMFGKFFVKNETKSRGTNTGPHHTATPLKWNPKCRCSVLYQWIFFFSWLIRVETLKSLITRRSTLVGRLAINNLASAMPDKPRPRGRFIRVIRPPVSLYSTAGRLSILFSWLPSQASAQTVFTIVKPVQESANSPKWAIDMIIKWVKFG